MTGQDTIITGHPPAQHTAATRRSLTLGRIRFILLGAVIGLAWAASLRGFMMALAGPDSTFTFSGTFGIIIPTGILVGALLGWAEHQRRTGTQHPILILAPLLIGIIPNLAAGPDPGPIASPCSPWPAATPCPDVAHSGRGWWPASSTSPA